MAVGALAPTRLVVFGDARRRPSKVQNSLTLILAELDRHADEAGVSYVAYGGTAIGAIANGPLVAHEKRTKTAVPSCHGI